MKVKNTHKAPVFGIKPGAVGELPDWQAKQFVEEMKYGEYADGTPVPEAKEEVSPLGQKKREDPPTKNPATIPRKRGRGRPKKR